MYRSGATLLDLAVVVLLAGAFLADGSPATAATKLIHMNNGRVLKAETVEDDGEWILATLAGGHEIGFPVSTVFKVVDDPSGSAEVGGPLNVVTSGRDVGRRPPRAPGNPLAGQQQQQQKDVDPSKAPGVQSQGSRIRGLMPGQRNNPALNRQNQNTAPTGGLRSRNRNKKD